MKAIAENLWVLVYPLPLLGADLKRVVTVLRLRSDELVIHSTGPFTAEDAAAIKAVGKPGWILDTMLRHDTFAKQGRDTFPGIPYLAPAGFSKSAGFPTGALIPAPAGWGDEVEILRLEGVPSMEEHVVFHRPSRTLIVADLFFNFGPQAPAWTRFLMRLAVGKKHDPGMARSMRLTVKDKPALRRSLDAMMAWDFDRVIVGHGEIIESDGKRQAAEALREVGYLE